MCFDSRKHFIKIIRESQSQKLKSLEKTPQRNLIIQIHLSSTLYVRE